MIDRFNDSAERRVIYLVDASSKNGIHVDIALHGIRQMEQDLAGLYSVRTETWSGDDTGVAPALHNVYGQLTGKGTEKLVVLGHESPFDIDLCNIAETHNAFKRLLNDFPNLTIGVVMMSKLGGLVEMVAKGMAKEFPGRVKIENFRPDINPAKQGFSL